jgi:hypothetical protein
MLSQASMALKNSLCAVPSLHTGALGIFVKNTASGGKWIQSVEEIAAARTGSHPALP